MQKHIVKAWAYVKDFVVEGKIIEERPDFHQLHALDPNKHAVFRAWDRTLENSN